ncbi:hypothetical protein CSB20_09670 [bacterium DOLZORAL124_64_63]|nr:MAG: hypothetical protein CSB20_09670 [bacterium DOLZORAL124_64_63]
MKKSMLIVPVLLAALTLAGGNVARADQKVDRRGDASAEGTVRIENLVGSITVVGWDRKEVHVEGTLGDDVKELKFKTGKRKSVIEVEYPRHKNNLRDGARLTIHVPEKSRVEVECVSAWIKASDLKGEVGLESVSGEVVFKGQCRELEIESVSGSISVEGGAPQMELAGISGRVRVEDCRETELEVSTVSGPVSVQCKKMLGLSAESVSGEIEIIADDLGRGNFQCDAVSGSISFAVGGKVDADFEVSTFNGNIDNEFGQKAHKTSKYTPGKELEFTNGRGEASVELNSFSGNVRIRKK